MYTDIRSFGRQNIDRAWVWMGKKCIFCKAYIKEHYAKIRREEKWDWNNSCINTQCEITNQEQGALGVRHSGFSRLPLCAWGSQSQVPVWFSGLDYHYLGMSSLLDWLTHQFPQSPSKKWWWAQATKSGTSWDGTSEDRAQERHC